MLERLGRRLAASMLFWDLVLTAFCLFISGRIRLLLDFGKVLGWQKVQLPWQLYPVVMVVWGVAFLLLTPHRAIFSMAIIQAIGRLIAAIAIAALAFAGVLYLSLRDVSRLQFLYFVVLNVAVLLIVHMLMRTYIVFRHRTGWESRVLIVGGGATAHMLAQELAERPWAGVQVIGYTDDEPEQDGTMPRLGTIEDTERIIANNEAEEVVFTMPPHQHERIARLSLQLQQYPVKVHMVPGVIDLAFARTPTQTLGGIPVISLRESALSDSQRMSKRIFDIIASVLLLLVMSPVMVIIAILIKRESPGPVFFLQERIGENGRHFKMIKFRSMYADADKRWKEVVQRDAEGNLLHKHKEDPRITRVGHVIRRTSLDELPQLFNVLWGEMSLVGPRPEMPYIAEEYAPWQWQRFRVPPGITGWWQVNGRSDKPMHLNTEEDLYYIQNYSFWLDIFILLKTVFVVVRGQGAY